MALVCQTLEEKTLFLRAKNISTNIALLLAFSLFGSAVSTALPNDRQQSITIKADSTIRDEKNGITTFKGDVIIEQGSLSIAAEKVIVYGSKTISRIVATGKPAKLKQRPDINKGVVTAQSHKIEYSFTTEVIELTAKAYIHQDGTEVRGNNITYDIAKQVFKAKGTNKEDRVKVVMQPDAIEESKSGSKTSTEQ